MVGMLGLEPRNPEGADLQSAAVAAVPHPHFPFSSHYEEPRPFTAQEILQGEGVLVNEIHLSGRLLFPAPQSLELGGYIDPFLDTYATTKPNIQRAPTSGAREGIWSQR